MKPEVFLSPEQVKEVAKVAGVDGGAVIHVAFNLPQGGPPTISLTFGLDEAQQRALSELLVELGSSVDYRSDHDRHVPSMN